MSRCRRRSRSPISTTRCRSELIAQAPAATRSASRLLHVDGDEALARLSLRRPAALLAPARLVVFNDTRVIKARVHGDEADRRQGRAADRAHRRPRRGMGRSCGEPSAATRARRIALRRGHARARARARRALLLLAASKCDGPLSDGSSATAKCRCRRTSTRAAGRGRRARYQTVYARAPGAVAAPTAGLHFDEALLDALARARRRRAFVTLHVGAGTFQPVRRATSSRAPDARGARTRSRRRRSTRSPRRARAAAACVAVGTTTLRALEVGRAADGTSRAGAGETRRCSSRPAIASASSTGCSPISTCRARRC